MTASRPKITAIIINFNTGSFLPGCLKALANQSVPNLHTILVDNASTDNSLEFTRQNYPKVEIIENNKNLGFATAANQGIKAAGQTDYVVTLNPDVILSGTFIQTLVESIEQTPQAGMASGMLIRESAPDTTDSTGLFLLCSMHATDRNAGVPLQKSANAPGFVFAPCAAAAVYKKTMLDDICYEGKWFDETFFMYYEDVDIAWRAQNMGWKCVFTPQATALHRRGAGQPHKFRDKTTEFKFHCLKNRQQCMIKNLPARSFIKFLPWIAGYEILTAGYCVFHPRLLRTYTYTIVNFKRLRLFRKWLKAHRKADLAIIEHYFKRSARSLSKSSKPA